VDLKRFETEFDAIQNNLSIDDRKKYRKRLQFVKEKQTNANKGLGCQFWFLDAAKVGSATDPFYNSILPLWRTFLLRHHHSSNAPISICASCPTSP